ncbi:hypothetical protein BO70DRAFT_350657 [Aspergillus heteromorphus CBS 117.55]|uniref:Uncharacterized protein n=1 Tax=Aspergillus heteromorphus CBS 117.55 TaxID=1448321 RepID=A0A317WSG3_9EURO|nr:uncharacterized protein BO70DRAFT_350657 [Aspergillus heteromorphus CBS 117.55]PWY88272.1 hypothetical protein BO70DRAFT_350657 [Aspergillus heteromorphus CBS 117.55]
MILQDIVIFLLYVGHQSHTPAFWLRALGAGVCVALCTLFITFTISLLRVLLVSRQLVSLSDKSQTVIGKPLFFPFTFNHLRFTPAKDRFSNRFLLLGTPVGLRCRIGNILAVDDKSLDLDCPPGEGLTWNRILSHLSCWFSSDSKRYLHRGSHELDLREKLDEFLISQNQDPTHWPYAYHLGVPKFLGWARGIVTWWYLYDSSRELDAMIIEINNSYDEKRNVLFKLNRVSDAPTHPLQLPTYLDPLHQVQSFPSNPQSTFYKGIFTKRIFASSFEQMDIQVTTRFMDPLHPESWRLNAPFSNMTTLGDAGEVRMTTRMTCAEKPIDPTELTTWELLGFLCRWTLPGVFTTLSIVSTALRIRFTGLMRMMSKPPVRTGSIGRHVTGSELFYLTHLISLHTRPPSN